MVLVIVMGLVSDGDSRTGDTVGCHEGVRRCVTALPRRRRARATDDRPRSAVSQVYRSTGDVRSVIGPLFGRWEFGVGPNQTRIYHKTGPCAMPYADRARLQH